MLSLSLIFLTLTMLALLFIVLPLMKTTRAIPLVLLACVFSLSGMAVYYRLGSAKQYQEYLFAKEHAGDIKKMMSELKNPQQVIRRLEQHVKSQPDNSQGWFLLGRLYFSTQQYEKAATSLKRANQLKANDVNTLQHYAEALFMQNGQHLTIHAKEILNQILKLRADDPKALYILGLNATSEKNYQQAVNYWKRILPQFPAQSDEQLAILQSIAKVEQLSKQ